ncbi:thiamine phosphate synthase [Oricola indica]|uniref:thiamine phosphate synthase n=1 Tax=Oricola indica TaxID=2872591 RepID=UPI003CCBACAB
MENKQTERCGLVLVAPPDQSGVSFADRLTAALEGGEVASVIFPAYDLDEAAYQAHLEVCIPVAQAHGAAAIVVNDTRAFGRTGADGLHVDTGIRDVAETVERLNGSHIVGSGGAETRHKALEMGEARPDYLFFGRFGQDTHPSPHRKNVDLAEWWASMVEIPCILMGGASLDTLGEAAATGTEFVALSRAVFGEGIDPAAAVAAANDILESHSLGRDS